MWQRSSGGGGGCGRLLCGSCRVEQVVAVKPDKLWKLALRNAPKQGSGCSRKRRRPDGRCGSEAAVAVKPDDGYSCLAKALPSCNRMLRDSISRSRKRNQRKWHNGSTFSSHTEIRIVFGPETTKEDERTARATQLKSCQTTELPV